MIYFHQDAEVFAELFVFWFQRSLLQNFGITAMNEKNLKLPWQFYVEALKNWIWKPAKDLSHVPSCDSLFGDLRLSVDCFFVFDMLQLILDAMFMQFDCS